MLAENLVDPYKLVSQCPARHQLNSPEDDEQTIEEDEAFTTRKEEQEEGRDTRPCR